MKKSQGVFPILLGLLTMGIAIAGQSQNNIIEQVPSFELKPDLSAANKDSITSSLPLANKKFGIEIIPLWSVMSIGYELNLRGAISLFAVDRHAEITFPIQYIFWKDNNLPYRVFYSGVTYRRFFGGQQKGFYYSGGLRYAYIEGEILDRTEEYGSPGEHTGRMITDNKIGIYAGIGYRHFSKSGWYYGCNIITGFYFGPQTPDNRSADENIQNWILAWELLEIGYAF